MNYAKISSMGLGLGLLSLTSGCAIANYMGEQAIQQRQEAQRAAMEQAEMPTQDTKPMPSRSTPAKMRDQPNQTDQGVQVGMTPEQVFARLGQPTVQSAQYVWSTIEGDISVNFDTRNRATSMWADQNVSAARRQAIRTLVQKQASYNVIAASLGGDLRQMTKGAMTWEIPQKGKLRVEFRANRVVRLSWRR